MTIVEITGGMLRAALPAFHSKSSPSGLQSRVLASRLGRDRVVATHQARQRFLKERPRHTFLEASGALTDWTPRAGVGFTAADLIAFCRSKTISKAVHAQPADGPCRKAGTVCVGVNLISADGTPGVSVAVSVRAYRLVANRTRRPAGAVAISADVLTADPACRIAVPISVGVDGAIAVSACRITRSVRVKDGALGVRRRNGCCEHQRYKNEALHRTPPLLLVRCDLR